ncbi:MAG: acyl-[ACP]--phospholipid O-acyltransferase, partial [Pseudomonadota bacterium]
ILIGTILGTLLITIAFGKITVGFLMIIVALVGYLSSRFIPPAPPKAPDLKINWNTFTETILILKYAFDHKRNVVFALFGVGWFYFLGGMFLAQMPNYVQGSIGASEQVLAFFLVLFSIGIAVGGLLNNRLLKGDISARLTPWAVLGISVFSIDLFLATPEVVLKETIVGLGPFLSVASNWRMIFDIAMIALCGGLFVVPLNAIIQHYTEEHHRARVVAGSAIINALFVILSSLFAVVLIMIDFNIEDIFLTFGILNIGMIFFMWKLTRL